MAGPIPVFAFAFAAFAATSAKASNESSFLDPECANPDELFLEMWRATASADADFRVKIGVFDEDGPTSRLCDRARAHSTLIEELWLDRIAHNSRGFSGVIGTPRERPTSLRQGRRIGFEPRHILGWTLGVNADKPRNGFGRDLRTARQTLSGLGDPLREDADKP